MSINLNKHKDSLTKAWKDVLDDKTDTDWALFGYEGQTNDLKVVSSGTGGLEEMTEDLNSGKIMYAFVKVNDPKTSLPKHVIINWQGEGANTVRKGICANHLRDIEKLFVGAQLTINARNEDEVEPQLIIDKVSKAGSAYSFKAARGDNSAPTGPVGTTYQRVNPTKEINAIERDKFWLKEEQEEKNRVAEERRRREEERRKAEEEARKREEIEGAKRDAKTQLRNDSIDHIKEAERNAIQHQVVETYFVEESEVKVNQSDLLREQRNKEAHDLIAQRTIDARSIFEKNTSAGQMKSIPVKPVRNSILKAQAQQKVEEQVTENSPKDPTKITPEKPLRQSVHKVETLEQEIKEQKQDELIIQRQVQPPEQFLQDKGFDEQVSDEETDQFSTIKRSPKDASTKSITSPTTQKGAIKNEVNKQENNVKQETVQITEQQFVDEVLYGDLNDLGIQARALYDYQAADDTEITFDPGDIITNIELVDEGWWQGLGPDGTFGLFPANYVELLKLP